MSTKYCVVAMRGDLDEFLEMIDFARVPSEKIGSMHSPTVLVATFISKFSMFELENLFQSVKEVNFFLMDIDKSGIYIEKENVRNSLLSIFQDFDERQLNDKNEITPLEKEMIQNIPLEIGYDVSRIDRDIKEKFLPEMNKMSKKEKQEMLDEILDRIPDISTKDKIILTILSENI